MLLMSIQAKLFSGKGGRTEMSGGAAPAMAPMATQSPGDHWLAQTGAAPGKHANTRAA